MDDFYINWVQLKVWNEITIEWCHQIFPKKSVKVHEQISEDIFLKISFQNINELLEFKNIILLYYFLENL